jgi:hypothetical protein
MNDWEQFFREKSARRERMRRLVIIWTAVVGTAVASAIPSVVTR